jgi:hypothetical protein
MEVSRRAVLAAAGPAVLLGGASCVAAPTRHVRPDGDPESVPEELHRGNQELVRHSRAYSDGDLSWGEAAGFSVRADDLAIDYGETVHISLAYSAFGSGLTGNKSKYNFELDTDGGWQDVRCGEGSFFYTDEGFGKLTGQAWTWEIALTEGGIAEATVQDVEVSPPLRSGRYRFVYWGIGESDEAAAVAFDLSRER